MDELVRRLRESWGCHRQLRREAADEIERLQEENRILSGLNLQLRAFLKTKANFTLLDEDGSTRLSYPSNKVRVKWW